MIARFGDARDWFFEKRFGLFIHWGIYSIDGWHEQMQYRNSMTKAQYRPLMHRFDPKQFDPHAWLDFAAECGMEYVCFTTKHIDGYCMWDTAQTDFKITNSPYGKDILAMLAAACRDRGFPLNLYYSTIDNDHPAYPHSGGPYEKAAPEPGEQPDLDAYLEFIRAQIGELCTRYGELGGMWWDCDARKRIGVEDDSINRRIRELQPGAVINNRGFSDGDFDTPERDWRHEATETEGGFDSPVEACQSVGIESWGFREHEDYYTPRHLEASMARILSRGGNYLLNIGPRSDGTLPVEATAVAKTVGTWLALSDRWYRGSSYLTGRIDLDNMLVGRDIEVTGNGRYLYVLLTGTPAGNRVLLKPIATAPRRATMLNTNLPVRFSVDRIPSEWRSADGYLRLHDLPLDSLYDTVPIIELEFDQPPLG